MALSATPLSKTLSETLFEFGLFQRRTVFDEVSDKVPDKGLEMVDGGQVLGMFRLRPFRVLAFSV